ncbi:NAD(P)-binding protein [Lentithecium fluviatile CBS 122367]|uniref:NAD(P)-binding protein n=1 Tax=Lentithecium fluviatile CBS 122367 TaxID=1168545 RepID=A0A6G1IKS1_9PLEO|nr:NAD(P)-binding protein [Lentithecium fluviatile CBS 122367]
MGNIWSQCFPPAPTLTEANLPSQKGKVFVITGGTSGVGLELAKILYNAGGTVYITGRSTKTVSAAISEIKAASAGHEGSVGVIDGVDIDLSDLSGIKAKANELLHKTGKIDVLSLNAGVMVPPSGSKTAQGLELQIGVNCVAHLLLAHLLTPALVTAAQAATSSNAAPGTVRVVWASSLAVDLGAPKNGFKMSAIHNPPSSPQANYSYSKLGNWYLASYFSTLPAITDNAILSITQNPGNLKTKLQRNVGSFLDLLFTPLYHDAKFGAYTELWASLSGELGIQDQGAYVVPWGRRHPGPRKDLVKAIGEGKDREFAEWCEEQIRVFR